MDSSVLGSRRLQHLLAIAFYAVFAVIFTYPLITQFGTAIPGPYGDNWQYYWNL